MLLMGTVLHLFESGSATITVLRLKGSEVLGVLGL